MSFQYIIHPNTGIIYSISSKNGRDILKHYIKYYQYSGGKCSLCGSKNTTKATCPLNKRSKHKKPEKHPNAFLGVVSEWSPPKWDKTDTFMKIDNDGGGDTLWVEDLVPGYNGDITIDSDGNFRYTHDGGEEDDTIKYYIFKGRFLFVMGL